MQSSLAAEIRLLSQFLQKKFQLFGFFVLFSGKTNQKKFKTV